MMKKDKVKSVIKASAIMLPIIIGIFIYKI